MKKIRIISATLILVIGLLIIAWGIIYLIPQLNKPSTAALQAGQSGNNSATYNIDLRPKLETTKYISFDYPEGLIMDSIQTADSPLESLNFSVQDSESWLLAITVTTAPLGKLTDSPSYVYRENNPTLYSEAHTVVNGQPVNIMTDRDSSGFSKVAFVLHDNELATISLAGDDPAGTGPLQTTFMMVLNSLRWL